MAAPIDFYFDFSSPYGYLAAQEVDALAARHRREAVWRPFLLGAVFKTTKQEPLLNIPLKGDYARRDMDRCARLIGVPFRIPDDFPFSSVAASRAFYWAQERDAGQARDLAKALYHEVFGESRPITTPEQVAEVATRVGLDREAVLSALGDPGVKDRLKQEVQAAEAAGVFGSPFLIVDGEPFWGHDRLAHAEKWLETGGW